MNQNLYSEPVMANMRNVDRKPGFSYIIVFWWWRRRKLQPEHCVIEYSSTYIFTPRMSPQVKYWTPHTSMDLTFILFEVQ